MKTLYNYLNEDKSYKIIFNNLSALFLFSAEISGQISDGYWENSTPHNHYRWLSDTEIIFDKNGEIGHTGFHSKIYSLKWMGTYCSKALKGDSNYTWCLRFLNYGRFGKIYSESDWKDLTTYEMREVVELLPQEEITLDELEKKCEEKSWMKKYWDKVKSKFNDELLKKYYSTNYGLKDLKNDLSIAEESINK